MSTKSFDSTRICAYDADHIMVRGKDLVKDLIGKLSFTELLLLHLSGTPPNSAQRAMVDAVMVTIMEHGLVPSAVVARLTHYGAPESLQGAVAAGLLGVGDRFAGTASETAALLDSVARAPEAQRAALADELVQALRERGQPVPGFGHPIHRGGDPRVARLLDVAREARCSGAYLAALALLESAVARISGKALVTNVSAAIAAVLLEAGVDARAIRGIVLTARCAGLVGHLLEEMDRPVAETMWRAVEREIRYDPDA